MKELDDFMAAAREAFTVFAVDERSRVSIKKVFDTAQVQSVPHGRDGYRPAFSDKLLGPIMAADFKDERLNRLMAHFAGIEGHIQWKPRPASNSTASANFADNHANGMIVGPGGIVEHDRIMIGASLLGPNVRYPDHDHAPEETYLVMTDGEFRQGDNDWFAPGCGGSFYNPHGIKHAMRSGPSPLFAFWILHR